MRPSRNVATAAVAAAAFGAVGTAGPASAAARPPGPGHAFLLKDQNGHSAYVNLTHVFSPGTLRDSSGAKDNPPRGKRWVVTAFKVTDWHGKIAEDADGDVSVIGTNHQVYETYITGDSSYN